MKDLAIKAKMNRIAALQIQKINKEVWLVSQILKKNSKMLLLKNKSFL